MCATAKVRLEWAMLHTEVTFIVTVDPVKDPLLLSLLVLSLNLQTCRRFNVVFWLRRGEFTLQQALDYTRQNAEGTGTQNLNYRLHMRGMAEADTP